MQVRTSTKPFRDKIYLLPNILTTVALFCGFRAISLANLGRFEDAAIMIFLAMVADGLDGRVARLTRTQSAFGGEYDSLSDATCFGVAPALIAYEWKLSELGKIGWLIAFMYAACTALRLARFNVQSGVVDKRYFIGLSCTAAAGVMGAVLWSGTQSDIFPPVLVAAITGSLALLMVSTIKYRSFKEYNQLADKPWVVPAIVLACGVICTHPPSALLVVFGGYALSGPVTHLLLNRRTSTSG